MTADSERSTSEDGVENRSTHSPVGGPDSFIDSSSNVRPDASNSARDEDNPELLRYRADTLLDEMMLSAVDVSAADYGSSADGDAFDPEAGPFDADDSGDGTTQTNYRPSSNGSGVYDTHSYDTNSNGTSTSWVRSDQAADHPRTLSDQDSGQADAAGSYTTRDGAHAAAERGSTAYSPQNGADARPWQNGESEEDVSPQPNPEWRVMTGGGSGGETAAWNEYVSSFRSPMTSSGQIQKWQPISPSDGYGSAQSSAPPTSANPQDTTSGSAGPKYEAEYGGPSSSQPQSTSSNHSGHETRETSTTYASGSSESSGVTGSGYVSAMAVMPSGPRRSVLLPRMSRFDIDALNREIAELHEEIRTLLPIGHDQAERAQHLLDKAHTIADSDPERSAEVEYYMQQVRMIVERTRDSRRWSNLYRDRLRIYLLAWALLATMTLGALWLSQFRIEAMVSSVVGASQDAFFMRNFAGALGSIMAGALGSALGSLVNMRRHAQSQYGFFDRKYGLRGLTLPIIGAVVGLLIYAVFATVYRFAGINPSLSIVAMATPAFLAFVFGVSQESLYGTTG